MEKINRALEQQHQGGPSPGPHGITLTSNYEGSPVTVTITGGVISVVVQLKDKSVVTQISQATGLVIGGAQTPKP